MLTTIPTYQLPLDFADMKQFIVDPTKPLNIDYKNSKLKGRTLLIYCTNVNIPIIDVDFADCTQEEKFELVDAYITHMSTVSILRLSECVIRLLTYARGIDLPIEYQHLLPFGMSSMSNEDVVKYCEDPTRRNHLIALLHVLDSIPLYLLTTNVSFKAAYGDPSSVFVAIDDIKYTGYTFVNILNHPVFLLTYYTVPFSSENRYFVQQFEEALYGGKTLYTYFVNNENNYLLALFDALFTGKLTPDFFTEMNMAIAAEGSTSP